MIQGEGCDYNLGLGFRFSVWGLGLRGNRLREKGELLLEPQLRLRRILHHLCFGFRLQFRFRVLRRSGAPFGRRKGWEGIFGR